MPEKLNAERASMTIEEVVTELLRRYPGDIRGETAKPGSRYCEDTIGLDFHYCRCAWNDPGYHSHEYAAVSPSGVYHAIGVYHRGRKVTCGPRSGYYVKHPPACPV
jgi:hypothetical protein